MALLYKLTDQDGCTRGSTQWGCGVIHTPRNIPGPHRMPELCSCDVIHAYRTPELGFLLNPAHADIKRPRLWAASGRFVVEDWSKAGAFSLTTTRELELPQWYLDQSTRRLVQIAFAALCAAAVLKHFEALSPQDSRPRHAIQTALGYVADPSSAADAARAARAATVAARAATVAARAGADAAYAARAARAARAAAYAARAGAAAADAAYAAYAAAYAARAATDAAPNFGAFAREAVAIAEALHGS